MTARLPSVNGHGSPPNGFINQIWGLGSLPLAAALRLSSSSSSPPPLALGLGLAVMNAMSLPSGDHFGAVQLSGPRVSSTCSFSVRLERIKLETRDPLSLSCADLTQTTKRQS